MLIALLKIMLVTCFILLSFNFKVLKRHMVHTTYLLTQEGMTPLDHLPQESSYEKLREFIRSHIEEQKKRRALAACNEVKFKMSELEVALAKIVGLNDVKMQIRKWAKGMLLDEKRRALGLKVAKRRVPHMAFLGNPGTGIISSFALIRLPGFYQVKCSVLRVSIDVFFV